MIKPKALQKGDLIALAAPSGPFDAKEFLFGVKRLRSLGFQVTFRKDIFSRQMYLAGSDKRRAEELNQFFNDPSISAILFARGGYGTQRILPFLNTEGIKKNPKVIVGYSDLTALILWLNCHGIGGSFYGPTVTRHFRLAHKKTIEILIKLLTNSSPIGQLPATGAKVFKEGMAEGRLIGGCLSLITSSIGTAYDIDTEETILFLEDVGEPVYKYDRMLTHLKAAGKLRGVKGIILGSMGLFQGEKRPFLDKMLKDILGDFPGPIITNFPTGHFDLKKLFVTLPLGVRARLNTKPIMLEILEAALA